MQKKYAHKHLDLFCIHLFSIDDTGIEYKRKKYRWSDIENIKILKEGDGYGLLEGNIFERLRIYLNDGKIIKINSRVLVEKNSNRKIDFLSGKNNIYIQLLNIINTKLNS